MLKSIKVKNFKKFESVELELKPFTVFMGENGSGKTTLLQAISLSLNIYSTTDLITYDEEKKAIQFRRKGVPYSQLPGFFIEDPTDLFYAKIARGGQKGGATPIQIELTDYEKNIYKLNITSLFGAYTVKNVSNKNDFISTPKLLDNQPLYISGFVGIPASEERLFPVAIKDRLKRGRASDVIRNLLIDLKETDPEKFVRCQNKLNKYFNFNLGKIEFQKERDLNIHANYVENLRKSKLTLDLSSSGSGFLQALQILVPIYRFSDTSKIILLDEPDAHLHPNLQRTIVNVLKEIASEEDLQIIISTHSTAIIREIEPEFIVPIDSNKEKLKYLRNNEDVDSEIQTTIDNFTVGKVSISGKLLFLEDKIIRIFKKFDELLNTGLCSGLNSIPVLHAHGKDDKIPFRIKTVIEEMLNESIDIVFIRDGDGLPEKYRTKIQDYAKNSDVKLFLLPIHEIENYLINLDLYHNFLLENDIEILKQELENNFIRIMKNVISMSKFGFDNTLRDTIHKTNILVNNGSNYLEAEGEARKIRSKYEEFVSFDELRSIVPGKEAIKEINKFIKEQYSVQITQNSLLSRFKPEYIDDDLKIFLKSIK